MVEELQGICHKFAFPPEQSEGKSQFISICGKEPEVERASNELDQIIGEENFKVEIFTLKCVQYVAGMWKKRWAQIKELYEEQCKVIIQFAQSGAPRVPRAHHQEDFEQFCIFNFEVFGFKSNVDRITEDIKSKENGSVSQVEIELPVQKQVQIKSLMKNAKIQDLDVWLRLKEHILFIVAPTPYKKDLDIAKSKLVSYLGEVTTKNENVDCDDQLVFDVLLTKKDLIEKMSECGKKYRVIIRIHRDKRTISLEGCSSDVDSVKLVVEAFVSKVSQQEIETRSVHVNPYQRPFLETSSFSEFCQSMRKTKRVCISSDKSMSNTIVLQSSVNHWLNLFIVQGDILKENVDAIVNAANEDLSHIGGLAKAILDAAGESIQHESNFHVSSCGRVLPGNVACLGPGNLTNCKNIIHAVAPRYGGYDRNIHDKLYNAVKNSLKAAKEKGHSSIALPALGTGIFNIPISICANTSLKAVEDFSRENSPLSCSLKNIKFILNSTSACDCFTTACKQSQLAVIHSANTVQQSVVPHPSSVSKYCWKWMNDSGNFQAYDSETCEILSRKYTQNASGVCTISVNRTMYHVDFATMEQFNYKTNNRRKVTRQPMMGELGHDVSKPAVLRPASNANWFYKGDSLQWEPYQSHDSVQLESWYQTGSSGELQIGKYTYKFDFENMTQTNTRTNMTRAMKRDAEDDEDKNPPKWFFQNDSSEYQPYSDEYSTQLEEWYQSSGQPGRLTIFGNVYSFNFDSMKQINVSTHKARSIKREGDDNAPCGNDWKGTLLSLRGDRLSLDHVVLQVQTKLTKCLVSDQIDLPNSVEFTGVKRIARHFPVECTLVPMGNKKQQIKVTGVQSVLQECIPKLQTAIIFKLETAATAPAGIQIKPPKEWQPQQETVQLFSVQEDTTEWRDVAGKFNETMSSRRIVTIERVQNQWLWQKYSQHKEMLHKKNQGAVNEKQLFHGTRSNDPKNIYSSEEGFDMRFCASGMWGQANYFAVNASYSDGYAHTNGLSGHQQMFLAYVLTGDSYQCSPNSNLKMPPEKNSRPTYAQQVAVALKQVRFDTVTGTTHSCTVYMTYDNLKAYPAYLITYERTQRYSIF